MADSTDWVGYADKLINGSKFGKDVAVIKGIIALKFPFSSAKNKLIKPCKSKSSKLAALNRAETLLRKLLVVENVRGLKWLSIVPNGKKEFMSLCKIISSIKSLRKNIIRDIAARLSNLENQGQPIFTEQREWESHKSL
jgi:hypothetical protein